MSDLFGNHIVGFPTRRLKWLLISHGTGIDAIILIHFISCSSTLTSITSKDRRVHEVTREIFIYMYMYIKTDHHFSYTNHTI